MRAIAWKLLFVFVLALSRGEAVELPHGEPVERYHASHRRRHVIGSR
jgi:hypothetical protein